MGRVDPESSALLNYSLLTTDAGCVLSLCIALWRAGDQVFFENIWVALIDPKLQIRECAAKTLSSCLALVAARVSFNRTQWYTYVTDRGRGGFLFACAVS